MELEQFTYKDISRLVDREEMLKENVSSIGTQSGGFGMFTEQARIVTLEGSDTIKEELGAMGFNVSNFLDACPTLKSLIK